MTVKNRTLRHLSGRLTNVQTNAATAVFDNLAAPKQKPMALLNERLKEKKE